MSSEPTSPSREPPRVLVLDADAASRSSHADVLRRAGFATREAESAASAELALADVLPHLVLLDPVLPGEDGLGFAGRVRDEHAGTALIALARDGTSTTRSRRSPSSTTTSPSPRIRRSSSRASGRC